MCAPVAFPSLKYQTVKERPSERPANLLVRPKLRQPKDVEAHRTADYNGP
jgi:hypothetical protein